MKNLFRILFKPLLKGFESGNAPYRYEKSHRVALIIIGVIFLALSLVSTYFTISVSLIGGLLPIIVFFALGLTCAVLGLLGTDRAVAKIWGSK